VRIAGIDAFARASDVRQQLGIIFQKPSLDLNLTAEENVRFHASLYGLYPFRPTWSLMPRAYQQQVRELAVILGIEKELFQPVKRFSGGMRRKLEIVRSLLHHPRVLFLDEPTSGLDPVSRRSLWDYLAEVRAQSGATIFLTTHYLEEAEQADTICILNHGRIVSFGTPDEVKTDLIDEYVLVDADDRAGLQRELDRLGIAYLAGPPVRIALAGRTVHELLRAIETPLTLVRTHVPALEDAYLEIVGRE